jgi:hypothetical protein
MRSWSKPRRHRSHRLLAVATSVVLVVGPLLACSTTERTDAAAQSSAAGETPATSGQQETPDPGRRSSGESPSQTPATAAGKDHHRNLGSVIIEWVSEFGLMGGATGLKDEQYAALVARTCDEIDRPEGENVDAGPQWTGAAHACRAAFRGQTRQWRQAEDDLAKIKGRTRGFDCLDVAAYHMLDALVRAHRKAPAARIVISSSRRGGPCPRITSVTPSHGDPAGGYAVTLTGINLPPMVEVHFGEVRFRRVTTTGASRAVVTVPPKTQALPDPQYDSVPVWPEGWPHEGTNTALFDYDQAAPSRSATPPTGTPTGAPNGNPTGSAPSGSVPSSPASPPDSSSPRQ